MNYSPSVHAEVGRQRRPGNYQLSANRQIEPRSDVPDKPEERRLPPILSSLSGVAPTLHSPLPSLRSLLSSGILVDPARTSDACPAQPSAVLGSPAANEASQPPIGTDRPVKRVDTPYPASAKPTRVANPLARSPEEDEVIEAAQALLQLKGTGPAKTVGPVLNSRLERLQYEARRCAQTQEVDIDGLPRFVFNVTGSAASDQPAGESENGVGRLGAPHTMEEGEIIDASPAGTEIELVDMELASSKDDEDAEGETDEEYVLAKAEETHDNQEPQSGAEGPARSAGRHAIVQDYFSYRPSASPDSYSPAPHFPTRPGSLAPISCAPTPPDSPDRSDSLSPILVDADVTVPFDASTPDDPLPSTFLRNLPADALRPVYCPERDFQPTYAIPTVPLPSRSSSPHDSMPALTDVSNSDEESDYRPTMPLPKPTTFAVVNEQAVQENVQFMTRHYLNPMHAQHQIHLVWVQLEARTLHRAQEIRSQHSRNNWQMLAPIRRLLTVFKRTPGVVDQGLLGVEMVDIDLLEYPANPSAEQIPSGTHLEGTVRTLLRGMALEFADGTLRVRDAARINVSRDGRRTRKLSEEAWLQTPMYRVALALLAKLCPEDIEVAAIARLMVGEFKQLADSETLLRGWEWHMPDLHQPTQVPPPYLFPQEYAHLRLLLYLFERHQQNEVVDAINSVLNHRFRRAAVVNHFLHSGLLTLDDTVQHPDSSRVAHTCTRTTLPTPELPFDLQTLKDRADFFLQNRFRPAGRVTQNWVEVGAN
ncbi:hypothetical protein C8R47DRAFT_1223947 [Mycena vitilis]|nr:hypothetical protein C8R47DRAFT_1223947 [Mycena vitilis]